MDQVDLLGAQARLCWAGWDWLGRLPQGAAGRWSALPQGGRLWLLLCSLEASGAPSVQIDKPFTVAERNAPLALWYFSSKVLAATFASVSHPLAPPPAVLVLKPA